ncbi:HAMP domain-containing protein [bacterium]|nr:HAMP domain-containing protein [bacterium]
MIAPGNSVRTTRPHVVRRLIAISVVFFVAQLVGSAFNIWYNLIHIEPLLTEGQNALFARSIFWVNVILYPLATSVGLYILWSVRPGLELVCEDRALQGESANWLRARVINLPWWALGIAATCWLICIPAFLCLLTLSSEPLDSRIYLHLPLSLIISGSIAVSAGFFFVELVVLHWLYPLLFCDTPPHGIPNSYPLTVRSRGVMWAISSCVCPIGCLLLLTLEPQSLEGHGQWFALTVGMLAIIFGLVTAAASSRLLLEPVDALQNVAAAVRQGNLSQQIEVLRADEFGPLISTVNAMIADLREKEQLAELFGRHVGRAAAAQLLATEPGAPAGVEQTLTVLFADLRSFTDRSERISPTESVALLNRFFSEMVEIIESSHGGMVNKFLGDGLMALFGAIDNSINHADLAVSAGLAMLDQLEVMNQSLPELQNQTLQMGVGICTGTAIVGSIGSQQRGEFTAIGPTVNLASRIETHTKTVRSPLLVSQTTQQLLSATFRQMLGGRLRELPPVLIRGVDTPVILYAIDPTPIKGSWAP